MNKNFNYLIFIIVLISLNTASAQDIQDSSYSPSTGFIVPGSLDKNMDVLFNGLKTVRLM